MFVITMYFEGLKEDWFCQLGHPRKIKNLLTYLLTLLTDDKQRVVIAILTGRG